MGLKSDMFSREPENRSAKKMQKIRFAQFGQIPGLPHHRNDKNLSMCLYSLAVPILGSPKQQ